jgi:hypothetical protein
VAATMMPDAAPTDGSAKVKRSKKRKRPSSTDVTVTSSPIAAAAAAVSAAETMPEAKRADRPPKKRTKLATPQVEKADAAGSIMTLAPLPNQQPSVDQTSNADTSTAASLQQTAVAPKQKAANAVPAAVPAPAPAPAKAAASAKPAVSMALVAAAALAQAIQAATSAAAASQSEPVKLDVATSEQQAAKPRALQPKEGEQRHMSPAPTARVKPLVKPPIKPVVKPSAAATPKPASLAARSTENKPSSRSASATTKVTSASASSSSRLAAKQPMGSALGMLAAAAVAAAPTAAVVHKTSVAAAVSKPSTPAVAPKPSTVTSGAASTAAAAPAHKAPSSAASSAAPPPPSLKAPHRKPSAAVVAAAAARAAAAAAAAAAPVVPPRPAVFVMKDGRASKSSERFVPIPPAKEWEPGMSKYVGIMRGKGMNAGYWLGNVSVAPGMRQAFPEGKKFATHAFSRSSVEAWYESKCAILSINPADKLRQGWPGSIVATAKEKSAGFDSETGRRLGEDNRFYSRTLYKDGKFAKLKKPDEKKKKGPAPKNNGAGQGSAAEQQAGKKRSREDESSNAAQAAKRRKLSISGRSAVPVASSSSVSRPFVFFSSSASAVFTPAPRGRSPIRTPLAVPLLSGGRAEKSAGGKEHRG